MINYLNVAIKRLADTVIARVCQSAFPLCCTGYLQLLLIDKKSDDLLAVHICEVFDQTVLKHLTSSTNANILLRILRCWALIIMKLGTLVTGLNISQAMNIFVDKQSTKHGFAVLAVTTVLFAECQNSLHAMPVHVSIATTRHQFLTF